MNYVTIKIIFFFLIERNWWLSDSVKDGFEIEHIFISKMTKVVFSDRWMWDVFYKCRYTWKKINLSFWSSLWDNLPCLHRSIHFNENIHVAKSTSAIQCESLRNSLWVCALTEASWLEHVAPLSQRVHLGQNLGCVSGNTNTRLLFQAIHNKNFLPK